jgi:hypothetical protein
VLNHWNVSLIKWILNSNVLLFLMISIICFWKYIVYVVDNGYINQMLISIGNVWERKPIKGCLVVGRLSFAIWTLNQTIVWRWTRIWFFNSSVGQNGARRCLCTRPNTFLSAGYFKWLIYSNVDTIIAFIVMWNMY